MFFFFFFQAEDGIRDLTVTGVQTCALPILQTLLQRTLQEVETGFPERRLESEMMGNLEGIWDGERLCQVLTRSEEHTSELQSQSNLVCRLLLEKKKHACETSLVRLPTIER